ncbi:MAG: glutamate-1-semialdehyde 2,1-aminomutase [Bdellovibrionales bacterium]|nr:glutamate-1-semialdehyde 2,1-aminomutase [Bdellovibrionales bacterium]
MSGFPANIKVAKSVELNERAKRVLVGGVNSPVRSFKRVGGHPIFAKDGDGAFLRDVDGNSYIDLVMSYGPHLFGHAHPSIVEAVAKAVRGSSCLGMSSEGECAWAEKLVARIPGAEKARALSTGTEACATAIRLARGIAGREMIVKFSGHYHGHVDSLLFDSGSGVATLSMDSVPESKGLPAALAALTKSLTFNDEQSVEDFFKKHGTQVAAVILEPIMGNMGVVPPQASFLKTLRRLCDQHGAMLIFDEVMTGLRVHKHSAQGLYGIVPDLTTLGKIVGGGMPLSAVAGAAKFMDHLAPLGGVYQAGTLSGNPVSIAAGIAMLDLIDAQNPYDRLEKVGKRFEDCFYRAAADKKVELRIERVGSMISFYFRGQPVRNADDCRNSNLDLFTKFFWAMIEEGFMMPPSPFEACFLSTAHESLSEDLILSKAQKVFAKVAASGS